MNSNDRIKKVEALLEGAFFTTNTTDIFFLTGLTLSKGMLLLQKGGSVLFVDTRYQQYARQKGSLPIEELSLDHVKNQLKVKPLYIDGTDLPYSQGMEVIEKLGARCIEGVNPITLVRAQKDEKEIRAIRKSCLLLGKAYEHIRRKIRVGISEEELALEFEIFARKQGADRLAFDPIIAFGANSAMPHHRSGKSRLKKNTVVLIDVGLYVNGYASDMTRSFFYGSVSEKIQTLYTAVKKAHEASVSKLHIGVSIRSIDQAARDVFQESGVEDLYLHALGHGVGLDVHEYPIISVQRTPKEATVVENMVVTIEPGLYLPRVGGIRLEEMYHVTKEGPKKLTV